MIRPLLDDGAGKDPRQANLREPLTVGPRQKTFRRARSLVTGPKPTVARIDCRRSQTGEGFELFVASRSDNAGKRIGATLIVSSQSATPNRDSAYSDPTATGFRTHTSGYRHEAETSAVGATSTGAALQPLSDLSEARIFELVESVPDALLIVDEHGVLLLVNRQVETMFGYDRGELLGRDVEALIPDRYRSAHTAHRTRYRAEPKVRPMGSGIDLWGRRGDGSEFPIEVSLSPMSDDVGLAIVACIRDVSGRLADDERSHWIQSAIDATHELLPTVNEALSNVARHAQATAVAVTVDLADGSVTLRVADNGIGFQDGVVRGHGLSNLEGRSHRLRGTCRLVNNEHSGATLTWQVPV